jgi:hypothetical protein
LWKRYAILPLHYPFGIDEQLLDRKHCRLYDRIMVFRFPFLTKQSQLVHLETYINGSLNSEFGFAYPTVFKVAKKIIDIIVEFVNN